MEETWLVFEVEDATSLVTKAAGDVILVLFFKAVSARDEDAASLIRFRISNCL